MKLKLESRTIAGLALPDGRIDYVFWDADLSGFGLRLRAGGRRAWIAQYRVNGRSRRATLGPVGKLTPIEARQAARRILAAVTLGGDPQGDKAAKRQRATHTFRSGHRRGVAGTYNRSAYASAVAVALIRWSEHLLVLARVEGYEEKILPLRA
jgi:hypothetical protein